MFLFFGPIGRAVLRILKDRIRAAEQRFTARRKYEQGECKTMVRDARLTRDYNIAEALDQEVSSIFGE